MDPALSRRKRFLYGSVAVALIILLVEVLSAFVIAAAPRLLGFEIRRTGEMYDEQKEWLHQLLEESATRREALDSMLGWRYQAAYSRGGDAVNRQGLRSTREYSTEPCAGIIRVAAFGDSFVYANEVANEDAWSAIIEQTAPEIEVLNYGVGGYGTDQAYLRFAREGTRFSPHVVVIGFVPINIRRNVSVYRPFNAHRDLPLAKPRFKLAASGELVLIPNPLPSPDEYRRLADDPRAVTRLREHDQWYSRAVFANPLYDHVATVRLLTSLGSRAYQQRLDPNRVLRNGVFNVSGEPFRLQLALLEAFVDAVLDSGAMPLIVLFPDRPSIGRAATGQPTVYEPLITELADRGLHFLDLAPAFVQAGNADVGQWFEVGGHYSPDGNRVAAKEIAAAVRSLAVETTDEVHAAATDPSGTRLRVDPVAADASCR